MQINLPVQVLLLSVLAAGTSYLLGSLSFAIIITRLFAHRDIRDSGSGNAGMTNVLRTVGPFPAALTLLGDILKSLAAIYFSRWLFSFVPVSYAARLGMFLGSIFVLLGHIFPIFFGFRGGKGVLTCAGIFFVLDWQLALVSLAAFLLVTFLSGYVSLGSIVALALAPISTLVAGLTFRADPLPQVLWQAGFVLILAGISILMHHENIRRLKNGTENRFSRKQKKS